MAPAKTHAGRAAALPVEERRSMIVAAVLPLLLEHGDRVTSRQIAEAAGIAEGTIFRAFGDKDELVAAVVEAALDQQALEDALDGVDPALSFEDTIAAAIVVLQQRLIDIWRLLSSVDTRFHERARRPMTDSHALVRLFENHRARLTVDPIVAARLLRALTLSTTHPMMAAEPMSPDDIRQLFLHGVAAC
jgi:AcrR family transcriptional regulator